MKHHPAIVLRNTTIEDLDTLFEFQLDEEANKLAAFTAEAPADKPAFILKYTKLLGETTINNQTIILDHQIVGSIAKFEMHGDAEITYWIDKKFWGRGVAASALKYFLKLENARPLFGRVAFDNFGSQRVLEKCGFKRTGKDKGFANARQAEIEEFIYRLD